MNVENLAIIGSILKANVAQHRLQHLQKSIVISALLPSKCGKQQKSIAISALPLGAWRINQPANMGWNIQYRDDDGCLTQPSFVAFSYEYSIATTCFSHSKVLPVYYFFTVDSWFQYFFAKNQWNREPTHL